MPWWILMLALLAGMARAQAVEDEEDEGDETEIIAPGGLDGGIEITVDPFHREPAERQEPNRPAAVRVGVWPEPELDPEARAELDRLVAECDASPEDESVRYRLAEFYLEHKWGPYAEREFLEAARLDPESIRPWEGLLRVYALPTGVVEIIEFGPVVRRRTERTNDWIPSDLERNQLIARAYRELLERRPDELARRRELVEHLKTMGENGEVVLQARELLRRLPRDASMRFELAEALRRIALSKARMTQGLGTPEWTEAVRELETNLKDNPRHVRTILRLVRMLCHEHGMKAAERAKRLERRAFFELFSVPGVTRTRFGEDAVRMAASLTPSRVASSLWDSAMGADLAIDVWNRDRRVFDRWVFLRFPRQAADLEPVVRNLGRRGDEGAADMLLALLWHLTDFEEIDSEYPRLREQAAAMEEMALVAAGTVGPAGYAVAERFLRKAETPARLRRGVRVLSSLGDRRATRPLVEALAADRDEERSLGAAAALERLGDPGAIDGLIEAALDVRRPAARRREAIEALAAFKDPRTVETMKRLANDPEFDLVTAYGLYRLTGDEKAHEEMKRALVEGGWPEEVLRLAVKCGGEDLEAFLFMALENCAATVRPLVVDLLRERFWKSAEGRVRAFFLRQAKGSGLDEFTIAMLGELGGDDVVEHLLNLLGQLKESKDTRWEMIARALAQTGHAEAVRTFNKMRILERNQARRLLARELYELAVRRQAEIRRSSGRR